MADLSSWLPLVGPFTIQNNGVAQTRRSNVNFKGAPITDDATNDRITIDLTTSGGAVPTGTGFPHITAGVQDAAARAINLASTDVTGTLPTANQASQTMAGDVTGTTAVSVVATLTGSAGLVSVPSAAMAFGSTPSLVGTVRLSTGASCTWRDSATDYYVFSASGANLNLGASAGFSNEPTNTSLCATSAGHVYTTLGGTTVLDAYVFAGISHVDFYADQPAVLALKASTADVTANSFTLQGQNTTAAASTGGNVVIAAGTGTSANGSIGLSNVTTTTTAPGAGGAGALPATPAGYVSLNINGTARKVAYY